MSQYNKTVLTHAGLELAKRANAGQAKFGITRAVTSADDWSHKTVQDLEEVTTIPNIMQQGTIMDANEVESNNSVIGVSLCFTNKNLSTGYQIRVIGLYVKEEGQENDFLYAVTTAITPEYMPSFADKVLYRFNTQMYLVIGNAQSVNVVINEGTAVTHEQLDKYKDEVTANLKKIEDAHKEDMGHVVKSASINGGAEILPNEAGKLELVVPDPDLSKYVSLEQLGELLKAKADITAVPDKTDTEEGIRQAKAMAKAADDKAQDALNRKADKADTYTKSNIDDIHSKSYFRKQGIDQNGNTIEIRKSAIKLDNGGYAFDIWSEDWTAYKLADVLAQLPNKVDTSTVNAQIADAKNTIKSNVDNLHNDLQNQINANDKGTITTGYDWNTGTPTNESRALQDAWIVDQIVLKGAVDRMNSINSNANGRLSLDGGNMSLRSTINWTGGGIDDKTGNLGGLHWSGGTDTASIYGDQDGSDNLDLAFDLGDDGSNHFSFRNNGSEVAAIQSNGHYTGTVDWNNVSGHPDVDAINNRVNVAGSLFRQIANSNTWQDIFGVPNGNNVLTSLRINNGGSGALLNEWAAGIGFGGNDTKGVLSVDCYDHNARITGGNGDAPTWSEDIAWKSDINSLQNTINQQNQTIQSLTSQLNDAVNQINYIKANYIEGKQFPSSQEAQATAWESANPQRVAFITD